MTKTAGGSKAGTIKSARKRKRAAPLWKDATVLAAAGLVVAAVVGAGFWRLDRTGWIDNAVAGIDGFVVETFADIGFRVEDVLVVGRDRTGRANLLKALRVERGAPLFGFDPREARARIESLPWVMAASVERLLPNTVLVRVEEREPLALWQKNGRFRLIDRRGEVIVDRDLKPFANLPVLAGEGAPKHAADLIALIKAEPHLAAMVKAAVRVGDRRWNVRLVNNIDIRLPEIDARGAWRRLADYQRRHRVLERDVRVLDLRLPDRLIVETGGERKSETPRRVSDRNI